LLGCKFKGHAFKLFKLELSWLEINLKSLMKAEIPM